MALDGSNQVPKRFSILVPSPKTRLNLGGADTTKDAHFGYKGISLQADANYFLDVAKVSLTQVTKDVTTQAGGKWMQYASGDSWMSTKGSSTVASDKRMTIAAGAGQGMITQTDHGDAPRMVGYNNLKLHYRVEEVQNGLMEFLHGRREKKWPNLEAVDRPGAPPITWASFKLTEPPRFNYYTGKEADFLSIPKGGFVSYATKSLNELFPRMTLDDAGAKVAPPTDAVYVAVPKDLKGKKNLLGIHDFKKEEMLHLGQSRIFKKKSEADPARSPASILDRVVQAVGHEVPLPTLRYGFSPAFARFDPYQQTYANLDSTYLERVGFFAKRLGPFLATFRNIMVQLQRFADVMARYGAAIFENKIVVRALKLRDTVADTFVAISPNGIMDQSLASYDTRNDGFWNMAGFGFVDEAASVGRRTQGLWDPNAPAGGGADPRNPVKPDDTDKSEAALQATPGPYKLEPGDVLTVDRTNSSIVVASVSTAPLVATAAQVVGGPTTPATAGGWIEVCTETHPDPVRVDLTLDQMGNATLVGQGLSRVALVSVSTGSPQSITIASKIRGTSSAVTVAFDSAATKAALGFANADRAAQQATVEAGRPVFLKSLKQQASAAKVSFGALCQALNMSADGSELWPIASPDPLDALRVPDLTGMTDVQAAAATRPRAAAVSRATFYATTTEALSATDAAREATTAVTMMVDAVTTARTAAAAATRTPSAGVYGSQVQVSSRGTGDVANVDAVTSAELVALLSGTTGMDADLTIADNKGLKLTSNVHLVGASVAVSGSMAAKLGFTAKDHEGTVSPATSDELKNKYDEGRQGYENYKTAVTALNTWMGNIKNLDKEVQNMFRPLTNLVNDAVQAVANVEAVAKDVGDVLSPRSAVKGPPSAIGLIAKDGISMGTPDMLLGTGGKGVVFVADGGTGSRDESKFIPGFERLLNMILDKIPKGLESEPNKLMNDENTRLKTVLDSYTPSLGFSVLSDAGVDLFATSGAELMALGRGKVEREGQAATEVGVGIARVAASYASEVCAYEKVVISARQQGATDDIRQGGRVEVMGQTVSIGAVKNTDQDIKDLDKTAGWDKGADKKAFGFGVRRGKINDAQKQPMQSAGTFTDPKVKSVGPLKDDLYSWKDKLLDEHPQTKHVLVHATDQTVLLVGNLMVEVTKDKRILLGTRKKEKDPSKNDLDDTKAWVEVKDNAISLMEKKDGASVTLKAAAFEVAGAQSKYSLKIDDNGIEWKMGADKFSLKAGTYSVLSSKIKLG